ncbi:MAG: hypothetical protein Pg6C_04070 [Treponemataceae bacterium]|nr:MAG: hypothetical protein Pg6C_03990 [Treponemataceae bacterium]GMO42532.1 MAG: hypothetical protein Pg6C_04070 [Treponemataceae bacterium]
MDTEEKQDFRFEDLVLFADYSIQKVLREIDRNKLTAALKGVDAEVLEKFYRNMSPRAAGKLKTDMEYMGPIRQKDVEEARQKIIAITRRLEDTGEIVAARRESELIAEAPEETAPAEQTAELIWRIERAAAKNEGLSFYCFENAACVAKALAAFENRTEELRRIRQLFLAENQFEAARPLLCLGALENLTIEGRWEEGESFLPESLRACSGLKYLCINSSRLLTLPEWIGDFTTLAELSLSGTNITVLPESLRNLSALEKLDIGGTAIRCLPEWIGGLSALTELSLYGTKITVLPESLRNLAALEKLDIGGTALRELPEWAGGFPSLTALSLRETTIAALPESLRNLSALEYLDISGAAINELPEWIGSLSSLKRLRASKTKIGALPGGMRNLAALEYLDISYTNIAYLPEWLAGLPRLKTIDIHGAPIQDIPAAFNRGGGLEDVDILREIEFMPAHELNHDDFVSCYYYIVRKAVECSVKARREGILALEENLEDFGDRDLFKAGLRLVVDGMDAQIVREILANLVEREHDPYKRRLLQIQTEAILSVQSGERAAHLLLRLDSMADFPDNKVSAACAAYYGDHSFDADKALEAAVANIDSPPPAEREEIRFMRRAVAFSEKARREGLLALESEWDRALFAKRDIFEYGMALVIDDEEPEFIKSILDALIEHEHDPWKRKLMTVKRDAVLSIQNGDNPRFLAMRMLTHFDKTIGDMAEAEFLKDEP